MRRVPAVRSTAGSAEFQKAKPVAASAADATARPGLSFSQPGSDTLLLALVGDWKLKSGLPAAAEVGQRLQAAGAVRRLSVDAGRLGPWDSGLLTFLVGVQDQCKTHNVQLDPGTLPEGARRLLKLALAVPERKGARRTAERPDFLTLVGRETQALWRSAGDMLEFLGAALIALGRMLIGKARFRGSDLIDIIFECGAAALPIVTLIAFLVGLILAFVGAVQLLQFGAQIYVANLVGIAMAREMGALMTAIIMAGRTGAAFAAQLGTMQVNEEIDALTTFGLSSMEFLVLPRMLALILMMPLLCVYSDLMGILGGAVVGIGMLDLSVSEYVNQTLNGVSLADFAVGIVKSSVFGVLVAIAGCLRGIQCGRSASAVGLAATSAVVTGIVFIIVTDGIFAVITNILRI
jgi:phospholipid/cholesterol/gamma-HCH transport system permease protein